jgi:uncharacterized membrane protein YccC
VRAIRPNRPSAIPLFHLASIMACVLLLGLFGFHVHCPRLFKIILDLAVALAMAVLLIRIYLVGILFVLVALSN